MEKVIVRGSVRRLERQPGRSVTPITVNPPSCTSRQWRRRRHAFQTLVSRVPGVCSRSLESAVVRYFMMLPDGRRVGSRDAKLVTLRSRRGDGCHGYYVNAFSVPLVTYGKSAHQAEAIIGDAVASVVTYARDVRKPIATEKLDFRQKNAVLEGESRRYSRMLSSFSYGTVEACIISRGYRVNRRGH